MSSDYTGSPTNAATPNPAPSLTSSVIVQQPSDGDDLVAASVAQAPEALADSVAYLKARLLDWYFGTGVDGAFVTGGFGLLAEEQATTWTGTGGTFIVRGWPMIARESITLSNMTVSGAGATAASGQNGYGGTSQPVGPHATPAQVGSAINTAAGTGATYVTLGGNGGAGGASPGTVNLSAGSQYSKPPFRTAYAQNLGYAALYYNASAQYNTPSIGGIDAIRGGCPGTPGAGNGSGNVGGSGGSGGCLIVLMAPVITLTNVVFNMNGGAGGTVTGSGNYGGGGGGGGALLIVCQTLNSSGCTYSANGGAAGTGPAGNGTAGSAGNATPLVVIIP